MQRILVLGAGFAGLWSAIGAARKLDELGISAAEVEIIVVNRTAWHSIRVRNYEADLSRTLVPLGDVLDPIGVRHVDAEVIDIDPLMRSVGCTVQGKPCNLSYDRLVFALGSRLVRPPVPGLERYGFDIDTYEAAARLNTHIAALPSHPQFPGQYTALVVGGGLTGIEAATELVAKLRTAADQIPAASQTPQPRVILADRQRQIGSDLGDSAGAVVAEALHALNVETRVGVSLAAVDAQSAMLTTGERIDTATVVWCAGMQAHPLAARFPVAHDRVGRLPVDACLKVDGMAAEFAAGDAAWFAIDGTHPSVMSCQHARPMGRFAGHNVVCDLLGKPMLPLRIDWYSTILDLGAWGAVCTEGWDRHVVSQGAPAKRTKEIINRQRIYPPGSRDRRVILDAAAAIVQTPPAVFR